jgi:tetratricopeptide (TPR) repeat protein
MQSSSKNSWRPGPIDGSGRAALNGYHSPMGWRRPTRRLRAATAVLCAVVALPLGAAAGSASTLRAEALDRAYNLDHDEAVVLLRRAITLAPDDPATHRTLAAILWLNILFRRGAVTVDHYLGSFSRPNVELLKPPPELDAEFRKEVQRAIELAQRRVALAPKDAQARYDLGAAVCLQASYTATVEGRMLAGFRAASRCYDEHERVLKLDPSRKDAGLIVGTYRYVVSTLSLPMRMMAYVAGFGGGRERGIRLLEETAAQGGDVRTDALFALVLVYNRERRYDDAMRVLQELRRIYPRNRLVLLEAGSTALRAGRARDAESLLTEGIAMLEKDRRPRVPGEEALWHYKRGAARVAVDTGDAAYADLRRATGADAQAWVSGRAHVELARLAVGRGDRTSAASEIRQAQALCDQGNDPWCVEEARRLLRSSHGR